MSLTYLSQQSNNPAQKLVVLLHGYGSNAADSLALAPALQLALPPSHFLAVNAPEVCELGIPDAYQWFPLAAGLDLPRINHSVTQGHQLLQNFLHAQLELRKLQYSDLILCGFSQGAAMSVYSGLQTPEPLGAIVCCSGFSLFLDSQPQQPVLNHTPTCILYGERDTVIEQHYFATLIALLQQRQVPHQVYRYLDLGHSISTQELTDIQHFLQQHIQTNHHSPASPA